MAKSGAFRCIAYSSVVLAAPYFAVNAGADPHPSGRTAVQQRARAQRRIALASQEPALDDPRLARLRRQAYRDLAALGPEEVAADEEPSAAPPNCWMLPREPGCDQSFAACTISHSGGGSEALFADTHVRIARALDSATFEEGEPYDDDLGGITARALVAPIEIVSDGQLEYIAGFHSEARTYTCDWSCDRSGAVAAETAKCRQSAKTAPADREGCAARVCDRAVGTPSAAVRAELAESDECYRQSEIYNEEDECTLAYANACTGLVGLVCRRKSGHEKKPHTHVEEYRFEGPVNGER